MKRIISNIPGLKLWYHFWRNLFKMMGGKKLRIGYGSELHHVNIGECVTIGDHCKLFKVSVGRFSYISGDISLKNVEMGNFCAVAPGVKAGLGIHPLDYVSIHPSFYSVEDQVSLNFVSKNHFEDQKPIHIGHDVWIGANAVILDGVKIGNGAVIAAGAVVTEDVKDYEIVGGVPAKHIKFRMSEEEMSAVTKSEWWNWDKAQLKSKADLFRDLKKFVGEV